MPYGAACPAAGAPSDGEAAGGARDGERPRGDGPHRCERLHPWPWPFRPALALAVACGVCWLGEVIQEAASKFLLEGNSATTVAHALGFSEPSAFRRAFRTWTGCSPGAYVKRQAL
ncbi:MAG: AraC family transcriptional regulator [Candidatus Sericytochromatia bacterium]|nr:AraC family transcriptional regulator [Candidatus Sericytochromatia bacterium]